MQIHRLKPLLQNDSFKSLLQQCLGIHCHVHNLPGWQVLWHCSRTMSAAEWPCIAYHPAMTLRHIHCLFGCFYHGMHHQGQHSEARIQCVVNISLLSQDPGPNWRCSL